VSERERIELEGSGSYHLDAAPVDLEAQRRELEEAGWTRIERLGKVVWRKPNSTYLYPQGVAIRLVREAAENESTEAGGAEWIASASRAMLQPDACCREIRKARS
jgi:hypothetical protein